MVRAPRGKVSQKRKPEKRTAVHALSHSRIVKFVIEFMGIFLGVESLNLIRDMLAT
jgi:hypothetical protein